MFLVFIAALHLVPRGKRAALGHIGVSTSPETNNAKVGLEQWIIFRVWGPQGPFWRNLSTNHSKGRLEGWTMGAMLCWTPTAAGVGTQSALR